ncbi:MAG: site-specific DNA-methyltransferase [Candidatus Binataceae bacterium]|nr:site-specific DNA-methyltransferase [Candidatus Binataceae bacterium]
MAVKKKPSGSKRKVESYQHKGKQRLNNPPAGLVTPKTDPPTPAKKPYEYDPHLDPQLVWAGKAEHTSFEVPTVSLHVHERIEPRTIIEAVRRLNGTGPQMPLFARPIENPPLREAIEFYKHPHDWSNRLIAGDSLLVMNSLLEKEGMAGQVQMVYLDPPYGIRYGSNFQPFVNRREVKDGKDEDLTQEPEMIRAFRDTWELGIHSYLAYLRDRLLLARQSLTESGSIFVQISDENLHHVREVMDEVFGKQNFLSVISLWKTSGASTTGLPSVCDYLIWYARDSGKVLYRQLYLAKEIGVDEGREYAYVVLPDGARRRMTEEELAKISLLPAGSRVFRPSPLTSQSASSTTLVEFEFQGERFRPQTGGWKTNLEGFQKLAAAGRIVKRDKSLSYIRYFDDFPVAPISNLWTDTRWGFDAAQKAYVVQTNVRVIARCLLMTTDPGDLVFDPTCGSGTTAHVAEQWGRRWITCDTSRVAITLAKQRLMTATFDYYELAHPEEGVGSGFKYKKVPHVTLKSIANNPDIREGMTREQIEDAIAKYADPETLYDQPLVDRQKVRVTGPFTMEAVPAPVVKPMDEASAPVPKTADVSVARDGETVRQAEWRDELLKTGIRGKGGQRVAFSRVEPLPGTRWLHADAESKENKPRRMVFSFGPEHAPLEPRQVELAIEEAQALVPKPGVIVFAAFQFDPEAAKDIDETKWPGVTLLKAQMNADLLTEDLKKKRASNESFWLIGQPDIQLQRIKDGEHKGKWRVQVLGFDYYNTRTGNIESGGTDKIAMWMLDPDYDGRSIFPRQVFFPMADENSGWARVARNLKAEIDENLIEAYRGTQSLPFEPGQSKRVAVKIIDDRGIESLKVIGLG